MNTYQKIETLFEFDLATKQFIDKFYNPLVEQLKDYTWVFTEKIDGTNLRIHWDGYNLTYSGRTDDANFSEEQSLWIESNIVTKEIEQVFEQIFKDKWITIYGELYGKNIQKRGRFYSDNYQFKVFDIMLPILEKPLKEKYVSRKVMESICKSLGYDTVPILFEGTINEGLSYVLNNDKSSFSEASLEGVVGKIKYDLLDENGKRIIIKIKKRDLPTVYLQYKEAI